MIKRAIKKIIAFFCTISGVEQDIRDDQRVSMINLCTDLSDEINRLEIENAEMKVKLFDIENKK